MRRRSPFKIDRLRLGISLLLSIVSYEIIDAFVRILELESKMLQNSLLEG